MVNAARTTEDHNHLMEQASGGAMREAVLAMGDALVARGSLETPDDVFHLSLEELRALADGEGPADVADLVRRRVALRSHQARLSPPRTLGSGPPPPDFRAAMAAQVGTESTRSPRRRAPRHRRVGRQARRAGGGRAGDARAARRAPW